MFPRGLRPAYRAVPAKVLVLAAAVIVVFDSWRAWSGDRPVVAIGVGDEVAHLATGLVILSAIGRAMDRRFAAGLLGASVLIDLDHIPQYLGGDWLTQGTPRPYPHSVVTLVICALALGNRSLRAAAAGALLGLVVHFARDMAEPAAGVSLLWPFDDGAWTFPYALYAVAMALALVVGLGRARRTSDEVAGGQPIRR